MNEEVITYPIEGILDLHNFRPGEVGALLPAYLAACREKGIFEVRIIHGKGTGSLRRSVHDILEKLVMVASFQLAGDMMGGWGATVVHLKKGEI